MDKRESHRDKVLKAATIEFEGGVVNCMVRDVSSTGASLSVSDQTGLPDRFNLVLHEDRVHRPCRVIWRKEKRIGIAFD